MFPGELLSFVPMTTDDNCHFIVHECSATGRGEMQAIWDFITTMMIKCVSTVFVDGLMYCTVAIVIPFFFQMNVVPDAESHIKSKEPKKKYYVALYSTI